MMSGGVAIGSEVELSRPSYILKANLLQQGCSKRASEILKKWLIMNRKGIDLSKQTYEPVLENGKVMASAEAVAIFNRVWGRLTKEFKEEMRFPGLIVWINGAPGSGKGTNTRNVMRALSISARPIIASDLLHDDPVYQARIDQGLLINDEDVVYLVFRQIIQESRGNSIIVDGYPRTRIQAECTYLFLKKMGTTAMRMLTIVLLIDEKTSIKRQLARGQEAIAHNEQAQLTGEALVEVRKTDTDENIARERYSTFIEKTHGALKFMKKFSTYYDIDAKGSFDEVRDRIYSILKQKQS